MTATSAVTRIVPCSGLYNGLRNKPNLSPRAAILYLVAPSNSVNRTDCGIAIQRHPRYSSTRSTWLILLRLTRGVERRPLPNPGRGPEHDFGSCPQSSLDDFRPMHVSRLDTLNARSTTWNQLEKVRSAKSVLYEQVTDVNSFSLLGAFAVAVVVALHLVCIRTLMSWK
jgi:hypothetical protein